MPCENDHNKTNRHEFKARTEITFYLRPCGCSYLSIQHPNMNNIKHRRGNALKKWWLFNSDGEVYNLHKGEHDDFAKSLRELMLEATEFTDTYIETFTPETCPCCGQEVKCDERHRINR